MNRTLLLTAVLALVSANAQAGMKVERWGQYRYTQHKDVTFKAGA